MTTTLRLLFVVFFSFQLCVTIVKGKSVHASNDPVKDEPPLTDKDREHWAFKPLFVPEPPAVHNETMVRNDIDRFILAAQEPQGLKLLPQADPATLLRRLTFDLIGLPPSPAELQAYLEANQISPDAAYEAAVDRLLASERYGESWAQQWLDLARFAETDGFEFDLERKEAWKYRDWVISALNKDMPFDDFVAMQIAGDELPGGEAIATGFLLAGPDMPDTNFQEERMSLLLNGIASTVGSAFLGLTVGCAQCHDHPYDPISQADFYRLRACFDNLAPLKKDKQLPPKMVEASATPKVSRVNIRGDYTRPGPTILAGFPRISNPAEIQILPVESKASSGRRAALARWLTQPTNSLFLRSTANRIWQSHFSKPLVPSTNDFGIQGDKPTHPELLNWLAAQMPRHRWSLKAMHKLIVMSATYRQAPLLRAEEIPHAAALYAGFSRHRITGEELRDAMLAVSGRLNLKTAGESVHLPLPPEVSTTLLTKQFRVTEDKSEHDRRSIYVFSRRNLRYPLFDVFDRPDALLSCGRRSQSTSAPQALMMLNSGFSQSIATTLAAKLVSVDSDQNRIINEAILNCFSRPPLETERTAGRAFLERQTALTPTFIEAVSDYCLALLNASAFCWID